MDKKKRQLLKKAYTVPLLLVLGSLESKAVSGCSDIHLPLIVGGGCKNSEQDFDRNLKDTIKDYVSI
jgi:hypothetical protein